MPPLHRRARGRPNCCVRSTCATARRRACRRPASCGGGSTAAFARSTRDACSGSPWPRRPLALAAAAGGAVGVLQVAAPWLPGPATVGLRHLERGGLAVRHVGAAGDVLLDTPDGHRRSRLVAAGARRLLSRVCRRVNDDSSGPRTATLGSGRPAAGVKCRTTEARMTMLSVPDHTEAGGILLPLHQPGCRR